MPAMWSDESMPAMWSDESMPAMWSDESMPAISYVEHLVNDYFVYDHIFAH